MDYGRRLEFGVSLAPNVDALDAILEARAADEARSDGIQSSPNTR